MKSILSRQICVLITISLWGPSLFSQDIIYLNNGTEIKAKIIELTSETVKYRKYEQPDGPLRNISYFDLFMILYEDGTREVFKAEDRPTVQSQWREELLPQKESGNVFFSQNNNQDFCFQGQQDAYRYYTGYKEAAAWTGVATILGGAILGIIPAIACSSSDPQSSSFSVPDNELLRNSTYYQCYSREAKRIKSKKVWTYFGIGVAVDVALGIIIFSATE